MTEGNMLKMARWFTPLLLLFLLISPHQLKADNSLHEQIDHLITREMFGPVTNRSTDGEFLRRLYLDLTGSIPPADVAHRFLADSSPEKRAALIVLECYAVLRSALGARAFRGAPQALRRRSVALCPAPVALCGALGILELCGE